MHCTYLKYCAHHLEICANLPQFSCLIFCMAVHPSPSKSHATKSMPDFCSYNTMYIFITSTSHLDLCAKCTLIYVPDINLDFCTQKTYYMTFRIHCTDCSFNACTICKLFLLFCLGICTLLLSRNMPSL